ncbi:3-ketoacyl-CoA synthase 6-like [Phoenix dactylifera]|uniref:3-ketoacyl-CoA synthase n=1 Tax=Phoenix dactylifera TaxID=42345 RepID=A0A8B7CJZ0_PHODC|nr:3-ketoacyl-CoA synthase 6-like [Phoenix dactylifera]
MSIAEYFKLCCHCLFNNFLAISLVSSLMAALIEVLGLGPDEVQKLWTSFQAFDAFYLLFFWLAFIVLATVYFMSRPRPIYLVDFACYKPPASCRFPFSKFMNHSTKNEVFEPSSIEFQRKILERSGLGEDTSLPPAHHVIPFTPTMAKSREESELVLFSVVDSLFRKTKVKPRDIDILVVNCSLFSPTPSLSAMIVNKYKMRGNIRSFNLSGMGCSAGIISIDLARDELLVHANSNALVVTTEIITEQWYTGNRRSMLLANCLFRMGGAAVLLSNKRQEKRKAKYELLHVVRTHHGADDRAYRCVYQEEDAEKKIGVSLSRDLTAIAGAALKANIAALGPLVLPLSEQVLFFLNTLGRRFANPKWRPYVPDFRKAFDHFCIHAGGKAVILDMGTKLRLSEEQTEASRMTLHRFGNTSSSSPWYELGYVEAKGRMRKGDRVWQIGLGSGFKCNSAVWRCRRSVGREEEEAWADCIDQYPVQVAERDLQH